MYKIPKLYFEDVNKGNHYNWDEWWCNDYGPEKGGSLGMNGCKMASISCRECKHFMSFTEDFEYIYLRCKLDPQEKIDKLRELIEDRKNDIRRN